DPWPVRGGRLSWNRTGARPSTSARGGSGMWMRSCSPRRPDSAVAVRRAGAGVRMRRSVRETAGAGDLALIDGADLGGLDGRDSHGLAGERAELDRVSRPISINM